MAHTRTVEVTIRGRVFTLTGDDATLFEAKVDRYRKFEFTVPDDPEPVLIDFADLRVCRKSVFVDDVGG